MDFKTDFTKFATSKGIAGGKIDSYSKIMNGMISPTIIEERPMNVATMDVFSALIRERIIFLGTDIDSDVANIINAQLLYLNSISDDDVKMFINTNGGCVISGLAIIDTMNFIDANVQTYCMGLAASMGSVILSSGTNGKRYSLPHSKIMIHQPMSGLAPGTQESDFAIAYEELKKYKNTLYQILSDNTGKSIEEITADGDRDKWLDPSDAVPGVYGELGLIDKIITKKEK